LNNKVGFYILESYIKNIFPFWKKTFNILSDYTIYKWFTIKKNLYFNINKWFIKKITFNWIFLSKSLFIFKDYFNIFDNQKRSYKLWLLKKKKYMPLLLPYHIYQNAKFYFKKGIRYKLPIKKTKFFALFI
jgi:hypothetical protein